MNVIHVMQVPIARDKTNERLSKIGEYLESDDECFASLAKVRAGDEGKHVYIDGISSAGVVRFVGSSHTKSGDRVCGVELDEPTGKHNGTDDG